MDDFIEFFVMATTVVTIMMFPYVIITWVMPVKVRRFYVLIVLLCSLFYLIDFYRVHLTGNGYLSSIEYWVRMSNPPQNYFKPMKEIEIEKNKTTYTFDCLHKYWGYYVISLSIPNRKKTLTKDMRIPLKIYISVKNHNDTYDISSLFKTFYSDAAIAGDCDYMETRMLTYQVSRKETANGRLKVFIKIEGDVNKFLETYPNSKISLSKGSDK